MLENIPHQYLLIGAERINESWYEILERFFDQGKRIFLDSGIFVLTNNHKRAHNMTMNEALALHPTEIEGFDWLWDRYTTLVNRYGDRFWGYTELDQGGREAKKETRKRLHDLGIFPMPVYHPLNDGWDYFDELAETHERIAFGNIVQAHYSLRKRLVATVYERKRAYPDLWVHLLGFTPNQWLNGMPVESCDSSSWMESLRWRPQRENAMLEPVGLLPRNFMYALGTAFGEVGRQKAIQMCAGSFSAAMTSYRDWLYLTGQYDADEA